MQAWLETSNHLIHYGKSCVNHCTTRMTGGDAYNLYRKPNNLWVDQGR